MMNGRLFFNTALFDLDGTLVGTRKDYALTIVEKTLRQLGFTINDVSEEDAYKMWFGTADFPNYGLNKEGFFNVVNKYDLGPERARASFVYNDVRRNLDLIKSLGLKMGIVTHAPSAIAYPEIALIGEEYFDAVVIANPREGLPYKPNPKGIETCLELLGAKKEKSFYAGDSTSDIHAGINAGVYDVHVDRGLNPVHAEPRLRVENLDELVKKLGLY